MLWIEEKTSDEGVKSLSTELRISELLSHLLQVRGLTNAKEAELYLNPKLAHLADPFDLPKLEESVLRITQAIEEKEPILIVGDYDVDGITSTVILKKTFNELKVDASYVIPRRKNEGYGLTSEILARGLKMGDFKLVIALDCGTNSVQEAVELKNLGLDLIIVDHHQAKGELPTHSIILNPHLQKDQGEPWRQMCTAGLVFKLIHGLIKHLREKGNTLAMKLSPKESLALAALGTISDMVPLNKENRILARFGLKHLRKNPGIGLKALMDEAKFNFSYDLESEDVSFKLAPRINACGRLNSPETASQLLLSNDFENSRALARKMDDFNEKRKGIENLLTKDALNQAELKFLKLPAAIVFGKGEAWNPGVVGIVAGKMASALRKPCIVLAYDDGLYRGSGRGVDGVDLVQALSSCKELLQHWGGHPAAVGLSVEQKNLKDFTDTFMQSISSLFPESGKEQSLTIDATITLDNLQPEILSELSQLGPFGQLNPDPILALKKVKLAQAPRKVGDGKHFQFLIRHYNNSVSGIAWKMGENVPPHDKLLDLAFRLKWNRWNNQNNIQMILLDWKISTN